MATRSLDVVEVRWLDSETHGDWTSLTDFTVMLEEVVTVGLLMRSASDAYVIATSYDAATDSFNAAITIPACAVCSLRRLGSVEIP